ncbi:MAG: transcriptional regulator with XRE-family HTH domain [Flavobacteriales bacterium]
MVVNSPFIKIKRLDNGWTQQQLAEICDLNLRTIQRIEKEGSASNESVSALAVAFSCPRESLLVVPRVRPQELQVLTRNYYVLVIAISVTIGGAIGASTMYFLSL